MPIRLKHPELNDVIDRMLQGLALHMAYYDCVPGEKGLEHDFVKKAQGILISELGRREYCVTREYPYKLLPGFEQGTKEEADLVIGKRGRNTLKDSTSKEILEEVLCVMEFKRSTDTNGNVFKDAKKLKTISEDIDRLAIVLFQGPKKEKLRDAFVKKEVFNKKSSAKNRDDLAEITHKDNNSLNKKMVTNLKANRAIIDLQKIERSLKRANSTCSLNAKTLVKVKRVTKAYSSVYNSHPYLVVCISV